MTIIKAITKGKSTVDVLGETGIVVTRTFAAPRAMVFDALTKPELLQRWLLGSEGWTMPACEVDLRVGGRIRFYWKSSDGKELQLSGVFMAIDAPKGFSANQRFDLGFIGPEEKLTYILEAQGDETLMRAEIIYPTREIRDGSLQGGMTDGMETSYARMDEVLKSR